MRGECDGGAREMGRGVVRRVMGGCGERGGCDEGDRRVCERGTTHLETFCVARICSASTMCS